MRKDSTSYLTRIPRDENIRPGHLLGVVRGGYRPFLVVALGAPSPEGAQYLSVPLLQDRSLIDGQATVHMCSNFACQALVNKPDGLWAQLEPR